MKILIAGSHGMVGTAVTRLLAECGYEVVRLVRSAASPGEVWWDPDAGKIDSAGLEGFDGVIHLATMPWPMRWTHKAKQKIRANRLMTNRLLAKSLAECAHKPAGAHLCFRDGLLSFFRRHDPDRGQSRRHKFCCHTPKRWRSCDCSGQRGWDTSGSPSHPSGIRRLRIAEGRFSGRRWEAVGELDRAG